MVELLAAAALAPWTHPLAFQPLPGWQTGASGTIRSQYAGRSGTTTTPLESSAWMARNVRYRDRSTADPPNRTLAHLPRDAVIVWAVIYEPAERGQKRLQLQLAHAKRVDCCEAAYVAGGVYELTGLGRCGAYSMIVRIYFGSRPTSALRAQAQRALGRLRLPRPD
jgi:hypothetical protein